MFSIHCYWDKDTGESACLLVILQYKIGTSAFILYCISSLLHNAIPTLLGLLQMLCSLTLLYSLIISLFMLVNIVLFQKKERLKSKRANFFHSLFRISCKNKSVGTVNHRINKTQRKSKHV